MLFSTKSPPGPAGTGDIPCLCGARTAGRSFLSLDALPVGRGGLLGLVGAGLIVALPHQVVGKVLLLHVVVGVGVGVLVALEQRALDVSFNVFVPSPS